MPNNRNKANARREEKREKQRKRRAECCSRKTDLIRGKGRLIEQCLKCGAMLDMGPEPESIDWFRPIVERKTPVLNTFGQYIGEK